jgi:hypothetical protein
MTKLDNSGELRVQVGKSLLQEFAVARVLSSFQLLTHALAGQQQALLLALAGNLVGSQARLCWAGGCRRFYLLVLNRLALPSSCHAEIIPTKVRTEGILVAVRMR